MVLQQTALTQSAAAMGAQQVNSAICLRARYAMSGKEIAYGGVGLRARYAMSGTDIIPYGLICLRA
eukprot:193116-Rhodomonas_salina.3